MPWASTLPLTYPVIHATYKIVIMIVSVSVSVSLIFYLFSDLHITGAVVASQVEAAYPRLFNNSEQCGGIRTAGTLINRRSTCPW